MGDFTIKGIKTPFYHTISPDKKSAQVHLASMSNQEVLLFTYSLLK
jgi:hypothetical protein